MAYLLAVFREQPGDYGCFIALAQFAIAGDCVPNRSMSLTVCALLTKSCHRAVQDRTHRAAVRVYERALEVVFVRLHP